jgi:hypothetical protein
VSDCYDLNCRETGIMFLFLLVNGEETIADDTEIIQLGLSIAEGKFQPAL